MVNQLSNSSYLIDTLVECETAVKNHATEPAIWQTSCRKVGNVLQGLGRFEESAIWNSIALDPKPNIIAICINLGKLYSRYQEWERAIAIYRVLLQFKPDYIDAYWSLSQIYMVLQQTEELVKTYYDLGMLYKQHQQWDQAIAAFEYVIELQPDHGEAYGWLAQIYHQIGKTEKEIQNWYHAFTNRPEKGSAEIQYQLARILHNEQQWDKAANIYQQALAQYPDFLPLYYGLAELYTQQQKWQQAINIYKQILVNKPEDGRTYHQIGKIKLLQQELDEAAANFQTCIELEPEFPWAYRDLIKTLRQQGKQEEVIQVANLAIAKLEDASWAYVHLGSTWQAMGNTERAVQCFQQVCSLRGWAVCPDKNYQFSFDPFSYKIKHLEPHIQGLVGAEIKILEIGTLEGMSSCWFLDQVLTNPSGILTCIDQQFSQVFQDNIVRSEAQNKVTKLEGSPHVLLSFLEANSYHLVNLQEPTKTARHVLKDATMAWKLIKQGGFLLFNDWNNSNQNADRPQAGIKSFLKQIEGQFTIVNQAPLANLLIISKN